MGTISIEAKPAYAVKCLICGDSVGTYHTAPIYYAVCLNCKKAVLHVREQMESKAIKPKEHQ